MRLYIGVIIFLTIMKSMMDCYSIVLIAWYGAFLLITMWEFGGTMTRFHRIGIPDEPRKDTYKHNKNSKTIKKERHLVAPTTRI